MVTLVEMLRDPALFPAIVVFAALLGLAVGSFLNVVIHRVPRGESIISPPSHCPGCDRRIRWHENIPVLSWLLLRGRCAGCGSSISPRYMIVELLGAAAAVIPLAVDGASWTALGGIILGWHLIALAVIDLETRLVPDAIVLSLGLLGLAVFSLEAGWTGVKPGLIAAAILVVFFLLLRWVSHAVMKREAMGAGDVTMVAAIGVYLTPLVLPLFLLLSSASVLVASLLWAWVRKTSLQNVEIPFGPGLALGAWVTYFAGELMFGGLLGLVP